MFANRIIMTSNGSNDLQSPNPTPKKKKIGKSRQVRSERPRKLCQAKHEWDDITTRAESIEMEDGRHKRPDSKFS